MLDNPFHSHQQPVHIKLKNNGREPMGYCEGQPMAMWKDVKSIKQPWAFISQSRPHSTRGHDHQYFSALRKPVPRYTSSQKLEKQFQKGKEMEIQKKRTNLFGPEILRAEYCLPYHPNQQYFSLRTAVNYRELSTNFFELSYVDPRSDKQNNDYTTASNSITKSNHGNQEPVNAPQSPMDVTLAPKCPFSSSKKKMKLTIDDAVNNEEQSQSANLSVSGGFRMQNNSEESLPSSTQLIASVNESALMSGDNFHNLNHNSNFDYKHVKKGNGGDRWQNRGMNKGRHGFPPSLSYEGNKYTLAEL